MADLRAQLKARTDKLTGMMEAAAQSAADIDELRSQLEAARVEMAELEELRELKKDIERNEKQQAAIIENQVSRKDDMSVDEPGPVHHACEFWAVCAAPFACPTWGPQSSACPTSQNRGANRTVVCSASM